MILKPKLNYLKPKLKYRNQLISMPITGFTFTKPLLIGFESDLCIKRTKSRHVQLVTLLVLIKE